jgi:flagellar motor switch protein FliM
MGSVRVVAHDFRSPAFLAEAELRRLRPRHEDFTRYLGARLSLYLRREFGLKFTALATTSHAGFTGALDQPAHLCLFKAPPLSGVGILAISPRLALTVADRLLGGRGQVTNAERALTEIETALLDDIDVIMIEEWCGLWRSALEIAGSVVGHESSARYLQTSTRDTAMLVLTMEATFGDCTEPVQIAVPYPMLEPVLQQLQSRHRPAKPPGPVAAKALAWLPAYDRIDVPVRAEWTVPEMTLRDLARWRVGDLIPMPARLIGETRLLLNGTPKFVGAAGIDGEHFAVQIARAFTSATSPFNNEDGNQVA